MELSSLTPAKISHLHLFCGFIIVSSLEHSHSRILGQHPGQDGSLDPQEDVVPCDDLGVDLGLAKGPHSAPGIFLKLINKGNNSQHVDFLHDLIPVQRKEHLQVFMADAGMPEGDAAISFQREPFDELVILLVAL